ncbi:hypothetical protein O0L34_g5150 [Tuta absoluta]|nr:hypothetical protein O0L34_g5150 [Tuta absoluta]
MECPNLLLALVFLCLIIHGDSAPNRRSRAAKLLDQQAISNRESKLQDELKEESSPNRRSRAAKLLDQQATSNRESKLQDELKEESSPNRRSRAAKLLDQQATTHRESKLQDEFKEETTTAAPARPSKRRNKALNLFGFFPSFLSSGLDYSEDDDDDVTFSVNDDHFDDEDLSRTIPSRRKQQNKKKNGNGGSSDSDRFQNDNINSLQYDNSPIFYIRLPPTPYMFVPGLGYVSQPPNLGPPMSPMLPPGGGYPQPPQVDPFINLPLDFVSNGKPTNVYTWNGAGGYPQPQVPIDTYGFGAPQPIPSYNQPSPPRPSYNTPSYQTKPKPKPTPSNSKVTNLKGQYVFNGKPNDSVYVLRDTYNSIYSDALQNFYP